MVFTSWQNLITCNPQNTSLSSPQPENPLYMNSLTEARILLFLFAMLRKRKRGSCLFATSVRRRKTEIKREKESK